MSNIVMKLAEKGKINPPSWLPNNICYLTITGSMAYGCNEKDKSDYDIYGVCIPPKVDLFPHLRGEVIGFGEFATLKNRFNVWQQHHVMDDDGNEYDFQIYNIVDYFHLCAGANPNMIDSLYTPEWCVKHITETGRMIRENRSMFLSKKAYHTFKGYAVSQMTKADDLGKDVIAIMLLEKNLLIPHTTTFKEVQAEYDYRKNDIGTSKNTSLNKLTLKSFNEYYYAFKEGIKNKRFESIKIHGTDVKFLYHLARLLDEAEQILGLGTLDLTRSREYMKGIRKGTISKSEVMDFYEKRCPVLEKLYTESDVIPYAVDMGAIKSLLFRCLEKQYQDLFSIIPSEDIYRDSLLEIRKTLIKAGL